MSHSRRPHHLAPWQTGGAFHPERRKELATDGDFEGRTGVFTSGTGATKDQHQIALFFTGQKHAGEDLADLLTLFLRVLGAPLDNNVCERVLKKAILHRKTALFYKTMGGARVGDLFMSIIHTAELAKIDVFGYLVALQRHHECVADERASWMLWNYTCALTQVTGPAAPTRLERSRRPAPCRRARNRMKQPCTPPRAPLDAPLRAGQVARRAPG
jgi:Transposase IS66 family